MILAFLLEERSAKEMLQGLLPRLLPAGIEVRYMVFEGKQDLKRQMRRRLRGWRTPDTVFIVMCDQDSSNCLALKAELVEKCPEAKRDHVMIRIVCRELESWYFGDLAAVENALSMTDLVKYQNKSKYRVPDKIHSPSLELKKITQGAYQKISGSREIGSKLLLDSNTSKSFQVFIDSIQGMAEMPTSQGASEQVFQANEGNRETQGSSPPGVKLTPSSCCQSLP